MRHLIPLLVLLLAATPARADEVVLKNGDLLQGQATIEGQTLRLVTPDGATQTIPLNTVDRIRHDPGVVPGRGLGADGELAAPPPPAPLPPVGGVVERAGLVAPAPCAVCPPDPCEEECPPDPCEDPCKWDGPWTLSLGLGYTQAGGNSDSVSIKFDFDLIYDQKPWHWQTSGFYVYAETGGREDTNRWFVETQVERDITSRLYAFGKGSFDRNEPGELDYRVVGTGGLGATFLKDCNFELNGEVGAGATWERRTNQPETVDPSAYVGLDYWQKFGRLGKLTANYDFFPNLDDVDLSLMRFEARYELPLSTCLNFRIGIRLDYQIDPVDPTVEELDWIFSTGIAVSF